MRVEFVDDGAPFDPDRRAGQANRRADRRDFEIGGYGTGFVQKFSRRMSYRRADGHNRLVLEFDAAPAADAGPEAQRTT